MSIRRIGLLSFVFMTLSLSTASAQSLLGGETLNVTDTGIAVQVGYPELRVSYHIPIVDGFEIAPRFTFFYAGFGNRSGDSLNPPDVGMAFAADFKWNFFSTSRFHIAAVWRIGFNMEFLNGFDAALQIGVPGGLAMNYEVTNKIDLLFGFDTVSSITLTSDPALYNIPFVFNVGVGIDVGKSMAVTVMFEGGPTVSTASKNGVSLTTTGGWVGGFVGMNFYL